MNSFEISKAWLKRHSDYPYWASISANVLDHRDVNRRFDQHSAETSPGVRTFVFKSEAERRYFIREYRHLGAGTMNADSGGLTAKSPCAKGEAKAEEVMAKPVYWDEVMAATGGKERVRLAEKDNDNGPWTPETVVKQWVLNDLERAGPFAAMLIPPGYVRKTVEAILAHLDKFGFMIAPKTVTLAEIAKARGTVQGGLPGAQNAAPPTTPYPDPYLKAYREWANKET